jgi:hypothetical protein
MCTLGNLGFQAPPALPEWQGEVPAQSSRQGLTPTSLYLVDERATPPQRQAIEELLTTNPNVMPFAIFKSLTSTMLGIYYVPFELELRETRSRLQIPDLLNLQLIPMTNPVTGEEEPATLLKSKGFTSQQQELCTTTTFRLTSPQLSYDHSKKYGEFSPFEYKGA